MTDVAYAVADAVATITLNAPDRRNALSVEMSRELVDAARTAESDAAVGAIVVTGGQHFCAGAVRAVLADTGLDPVEDEAYRNLETVYGAFTTIGDVGLPTIAAVRGAAVGAGLNLALATDLRIVSRTARLLPGFAQIGIHPGGGHFTLLNRVAGREAAAAMGLFGEEVSGERAVELRLAWAAHDDEHVEREAHALAARVATDPELARRLIRSFRRETVPGGVAWDVAVELERSPQMWSLRRKHGPSTGRASERASERVAPDPEP
ncbi:MAG TPA: enoyl-CoA hydratase-related protein [Intrasporangium sp.]|uniref:enoyl-CoA hydratase-related protein n=1 Tax=Intrasporangium sp. TaxID=1925024 RepID=UPI002B4A5168|nr:enoyl-CoA hydratase-related protein [Intrasporangium sp.]HKX69522.1 enoyl-CoA hydratase-related protein [Intrasporangium sp.]